MTDQPDSGAQKGYVRPKAYLDVDGVLNAYGPDTEDLETATVRTEEGRTIVVSYSQQMVQWLNEILYEADADYAWLTTWLHTGLILQLVEQLGTVQRGRLLKAPLPRLSGGFGSRWKVQQLLADQRDRPAPFVWLDDELAGSAREIRGATPNVESLLLQPSALEGVRPRHLTAMHSFYAGLPGASSSHTYEGI